MERYLYYTRILKEKNKIFENLLPDTVRQLEKLKKRGEILTCSLFRKEMHLFLYYEVIEKDIDLENVFASCASCLVNYESDTGDRHFMRMMDIYHNNVPDSLEFWQRKTEHIQSVCKVAWLKPEMVSSYIFYHYRRQEEMLGQGHKQGLIGIHENMLAFYKEEPYIVEPCPVEGKLRTHDSPENWGELMKQHFASDPTWQDCRQLFQIF